MNTTSNIYHVKCHWSLHNNRRRGVESVVPTLRQKRLSTTLYTMWVMAQWGHSASSSPSSSFSPCPGACSTLLPH